MKKIILLIILFQLFYCKNPSKKANNNSEKFSKENKSNLKRNQKNILTNWNKEWSYLVLDSLKNFKLYGSKANNKLILGLNPYDIEEPIWECIPTEDEQLANGGFTTSRVKIDPEFDYRFTIWVLRDGGRTGKTFLLGKYMSDLDGNDVNTPRLVARTPGSVEYWFTREWYLMVGYIYNKNASKRKKDTITGIYNIDGEQVYAGTDFKWRGKAKETDFEVRLNNTLNKKERQYFWNPELYKIDGTEPTLNSYFD